MRQTLLLLAALAFASTHAGFAATRLVDSIASLQSAINEAAAGDTITLKNGVYTTSAPITVGQVGVAGQPITVAAESVGGVEITGTHGFDIVTPAAHVVISGFLLTHASGTNSIDLDTGHVRFTRNTFRCPGDGAYLTVAGDDAQIDYNEFDTKKAAGCMIAISGGGSQVARRLWIHHNYLHDFVNDGSNGAEMIRYGLLNAHGQSTGAGIMEFNLFTGCRGVNEMISVRSSGNTFRHNTFVDSPTSHLTLRVGNDCIIYGNYFRRTEGLRIYGKRHQVFSNYFEGNYIGINLGNGDVESAEGAPANSHVRSDDCLFAFNTFVDNKTTFQMSRRSSGAFGATNITFANNILQGGDMAARIAGPYPGAVWSGNILWNTTNAGDMPPEGFTKVDPLLTAGSDGVKRLPSGSPAIEAALGNFPSVAVDMDGQSRPEKKGAGADEFSTSPITSWLLTAADVGPGAK
jgi:hypothetical protein